MNNTWTLAATTLKILFRNKQALYFSLVLPVVIMLVFGFISGTSQVGSRGISYRDFIVPGLIALTILQLGIFSVAFVITQYRDKNILRKLLTTPIGPFEFLSAQITARLFVALVQVLLLVSVAILFLSFTMRGSYFLLLLAAILGTLNFLTLGFVIAGLAKSVESVPAIANMIVFPLLLLGDVFFPIEALPGWLEGPSKYLPIQYVVNSFREIMVEGHGFQDVAGSFLALTVWLVVFFALAVKTFSLGTKE